MAVSTQTELNEGGFSRIGTKGGRVQTKRNNRRAVRAETEPEEIEAVSAETRQKRRFQSEMHR